MSPKTVGLCEICGMLPIKLQSIGVKRLVERALWAQGIRSVLEGGKKRHEFQTDHGFRKWYKTQCEMAGMKSINIEKLMGHSLGMSTNSYAYSSKLYEVRICMIIMQFFNSLIVIDIYLYSENKVDLILVHY